MTALVPYVCPRCKHGVGVPATVPPPTCSCGLVDGRGRLRPVEMVPAPKAEKTP